MEHPARHFRSRTLSETRGFYKALIAADGDRILDFTAFAPEADAVMTAVQVARAAGLRFTALRDATPTHPTMSEGLAALFNARCPPDPDASADTSTPSFICEDDVVMAGRSFLLKDVVLLGASLFTAGEAPEAAGSTACHPPSRRGTRYLEHPIGERR